MNHNPRACKHDGQFICFNPHSTELPVFVWACPSRCGYWLSFDPGDYLNGCNYMSFPSPERTWKVPPKTVKGIGA